MKSKWKEGNENVAQGSANVELFAALDDLQWTTIIQIPKTGNTQKALEIFAEKYGKAICISPCGNDKRHLL